MTPRIALLTVALATAAACSSDEASGPATAGVAGATTPATASSTTTTEAAETATTSTPASTAATTTTAPAPTTTALPGATTPTGRTVALFAATPGGAGRGWVPLGGWTGTAFVDAAAVNAPRWTQGREIRVSTLGARSIGSEIGADRRSCSGDDGPLVRVPVDAVPPASSGFAAIAVEGGWSLRPRPVVEVDAEIPAYVEAARDLLRGRAPRSTPAKVVQIVLADMNGDGEETSVVVFESTRAPAPDGSGFSILFTYDNDSGEVTELDAAVVDPPPRRRRPPRPAAGASTTSSTTTTLPPPPPLERFRVLDVADLNGDRVYELVTRSWTDDAHRVRLYELGRRRFTAVGESACDR